MYVVYMLCLWCCVPSLGRLGGLGRNLSQGTCNTSSLRSGEMPFVRCCPKEQTMQWLSKALSGGKETHQKGEEGYNKRFPLSSISLLSPLPDIGNNNDNDKDEECASCSSPCDKHANIPAPLLRKIDQSDDLSRKY